MRIEARRLLGCVRRASLALGLSCAAQAASAAPHEIINNHGPDAGFNDSTPVAPTGGNAGTTLGEQRQIVFSFVAEFWGRRLRSDVPIQVLATFDALDCDARSAVLGAAGAWNMIRDFPNAARAGTWYPSALANKLAGTRIIAGSGPFDNADIIAFFNGNLGKPGCLTGIAFYLGLDGKAAPNQIDLLTAVLHEVGHGLGFQTFTDAATGAQLEGYPSIWDHLLLDPAQGKDWTQMSNDERVRSAVTPRNLAWNGRAVERAVHRVLDRGTPELFVAGNGLNRFMFIGTATFGAPIDQRTLLARPMALVAPQSGSPGAACTALDIANAKAVAGNVALIDRGGCAFTVQTRNAQNAGAAAVIIIDNVPGTPPPDLVGTDDTIDIAALRVSQEDGDALKSALASAPRFLPPYAVLFENQLKRAGADYAGRVFMYTPRPLRPGSSVSHYDTLAKPNLLMEPFATANQAIAVSAPKDLTLELLRDLGW